MGSVMRRLKRHLTWRKPKDVPQLTEGHLLSQRLERAAKQNNATDPIHFLAYLKTMRRGYSREVDGASPLMDLVDEIAAFEAREGKRIKEAAAPNG